MTTDLEQEVRSLLRKGRKIEAVKLYKEHTGSGLKDAKDAIEAFQEGASLPEPGRGDAALAAELEGEILSLLKGGQKLKAVKLYRAQMGANLMESKLAVESVAARHGILVEAEGCSGVLVIIILALIGVAVLVGLVMLKE